jgi:2,3,4,5-tetrahydropyridine-2-carboxylate N-succinyltransferase
MSHPAAFSSVSYEALSQTIEQLWERREHLSPRNATREDKAPIQQTLSLLDCGVLRVVERKSNSWFVNEWVKKAILLSFRTEDMQLIQGGPAMSGQNTSWFDKVPSKFANWDETQFRQANFRAVPGAIVRHSAYIAANVVLMPSFVNVGAFVDEGTMIDTWATIGSCAQIGKSCHISGGTGIGGVLEPLQASPVIIEDHCFIGARSEIAEGVIVETGSVISMGVYIGASTKIIDRTTGEVYYGRVPAYSVVVPGTVPGKILADGSSAPALYAAVIVKRVDEKTRSKTSINELLRGE